MTNPEEYLYSIIFTITAEEDPKVTHLGNVGLFIYDLDSLYELIRLTVDPNYFDYKLSRFSLYRNGRPINKNDQLNVSSISLNSPLVITGNIAIYAGTVSAVLGSFWLFIQILDKISNFRVNHEKNKLELIKLRKEIEKLQSNVIKLSPLIIEGNIANPKAEEIIEKVTKRIEKSSINIIDITYEVKK